MLTLCILHNAPKWRTIEGKVYLVNAFALCKLQLRKLLQINFALFLVDLSDSLLEYIQFYLVFFHCLPLYESLKEIVDAKDSQEVCLIRVSLSIALQKCLCVEQIAWIARALLLILVFLLPITLFLAFVVVAKQIAEEVEEELPDHVDFILIQESSASGLLHYFLHMGG